MKTKKVKVFLSVLAVVLVAWALNSCSKSSDAAPAVVSKAVLNDSIVAVNNLLSSTVEGVADGQFTVGAKAALQTAVIEAEIVSVVNDVTAATVANAVASLATATTTFRAAKITPVAVAALVAHWGFDEGTGTTAGDASANAFNGVFKAGPTQWGAKSPVWTSDRKGNANQAIQFNNGASIEVTYNTKLNPVSISMAVWVKVDTIYGGNRFIGLQSWLGYKFQLQDGNRPFATLATSVNIFDRDAAVGIPAHQWHHLVVTYVNGTEVFYIDGENVKVWTDFSGTASSISGAPYNLVIGADFPVDKYSSDSNGTNFNTVGNADYHVIPLAWGGHFVGALDEVRIYNTALTDAQVTAVYNREK